MIWNEVQEIARLASLEDQDDEKDGHTVDIDWHWDEILEDITWEHHYLEDSGLRGTPVLQAIRKLCTTLNVKELVSLVEA